MAKGRKTPNYETRVVGASTGTPSYLPGTTEVPKPRSWKKEAIVLKAMLHNYGFSGKVGDVVEVDPTYYDELIAKKFIKAV